MKKMKEKKNRTSKTKNLKPKKQKLNESKEIKTKVKEAISKTKTTDTVQVSSKSTKKVEETTEVSEYPGKTVESSNPLYMGLSKKWNLKLVSWNINGVRAVLKSDIINYIKKENPDVLGVQEIKCKSNEIPSTIKNIDGFQTWWSSADKAGYAGTGLVSKLKPINVEFGIGVAEHDEEGRVITAEYDKFYYVTAYVPNSGRGLVRLKYRSESWDKDFTKYLQKLDAKKPLIVCGDLNVAHLEIDLSNPKSNTKTAGFTKEERDSFTKILKNVDLIDTFRHIYPNRKNTYTFWSYMGNSRSKNVGWRLDYFLISRRLLPSLCNQEVRSDIMGSDHCPIVLYMDL